MCWSTYEERLRAEEERHTEKEKELLRLEAAAAAAEKRTERRLAEKSRQREPVRS